MNYKLIEKEEEYKTILGEDLFGDLEDFGFNFFDIALVVEGNIEIDIPLLQYIETLREECKGKFSSVIFTGDLTVNNLIELDYELILLGKTVCQNFIEIGEHYFFGKEVKLKKFGVSLFTQGCIYFESLETPILFASENFPVIEKLKGNSNVFSTDKIDCIEGEKEGEVNFYDLNSTDTYNDNFLNQFKISEDYSLVEVFERQKEEIIRFLNNSTDFFKK